MIFENRYQIDKNVMLDWSRHPLVGTQRRLQKGFRFSWLALGVFFIGYFASSITKGMGAFAIFYLFMAAFSFYRAFLRDRINVGKQFKRFSEVQGGAQSWERIIRMGEEIVVEDGKSISSYQYSQVTDVVGDQKYIALMLGPSIGIRMERSGFTMGSADELEAFIANRKFLCKEKSIRETVELDGVEYEYAVQIREDDPIRESFNELTARTYGFDFEKWYQGGWWKSAYQPHVLMEGGRVVANVSANPMICTIDGQVKRAVQLGTVMTDEASRNKGLSRYLMERVLEEWKDQCDLIYLFANDSVLDFYPKFGFVKAREYAFSMKIKPGSQAAVRAVKLDMGKAKDRERFLNMAAESKALYRLDVWRQPGLLMFYAAGIGEIQDSVYYIEELDAVVVAKQQEGTCRILDVFSKGEISLAEAACAVADPGTERVEFGFAPIQGEDGEIEAVPYENEDDTLFVMGEAASLFEQEELAFPKLTHA